VLEQKKEEEEEEKEKTNEKHTVPLSPLTHSVTQPTYTFNPLMQQTGICVQAPQQDNIILSLKSKWLYQYYIYRAC
jgi:hypothetical protein